MNASLNSSSLPGLTPTAQAARGTGPISMDSMRMALDGESMKQFEKWMEESRNHQEREHRAGMISAFVDWLRRMMAKVVQRLTGTRQSEDAAGLTNSLSPTGPGSAPAAGKGQKNSFAGPLDKGLMADKPPTAPGAVGEAKDSKGMPNTTIDVAVPSNTPTSQLNELLQNHRMLVQTFCAALKNPEIQSSGDEQVDYDQLMGLQLSDALRSYGNAQEVLHEQILKSLEPASKIVGGPPATVLGLMRNGTLPKDFEGTQTARRLMTELSIIDSDIKLAREGLTILVAKAAASDDPRRQVLAHQFSAAFDIDLEEAAQQAAQSDPRNVVSKLLSKLTLPSGPKTPTDAAQPAPAGTAQDLQAHDVQGLTPATDAGQTSLPVPTSSSEPIATQQLPGNNAGQDFTSQDPNQSILVSKRVVADGNVDDSPEIQAIRETVRAKNIQPFSLSRLMRATAPAPDDDEHGEDDDDDHRHSAPRQ